LCFVFAYAIAPTPTKHPALRLRGGRRTPLRAIALRFLYSFYVFRQDENGYLLGVVDCAGHGVAGAFMTMLAYASFNRVTTHIGLNNPAGILDHMDQAIRAMLGIGIRQQNIATQIDAGFAYIDAVSHQVTYSGAKIALYRSIGETVDSIKGSRRALGERQAGQYQNDNFPLQDNMTLYLTTDGFLDQNGGEKNYGYGNARFMELIRGQAGQPPAAQGQAFAEALAAWRGNNPQRDDITVLGFQPPAQHR
ncbi:MAG: serine/threonine-protein phosphatase, partial [Methylococcaceae bacterium]